MVHQHRFGVARDRSQPVRRNIDGAGDGCPPAARILVFSAEPDVQVDLVGALRPVEVAGWCRIEIPQPLRSPGCTRAANSRLRAVPVCPMPSDREEPHLRSRDPVVKPRRRAAKVGVGRRFDRARPASLLSFLRRDRGLADREYRAGRRALRCRTSTRLR